MEVWSVVSVRSLNGDSLTKPYKTSDVIVVPNPSSPIGIPVLNISMSSSPKITTQTTCLAFSLSPPDLRHRQISVSESEDSFIVFDDDNDDLTQETEEFESDCESSEDEEEEICDNESDTDSPSSIIPTKKVRFANDKDLCEVHPMIQWSFAYQAARKGPWEMYARDRDRFKMRIENVGTKISHCFEPEHRQKVYNQRFCTQED